MLLVLGERHVAKDPHGEFRTGEQELEHRVEEDEQKQEEPGGSFGRSGQTTTDDLRKLLSKLANL